MAVNNNYIMVFEFDPNSTSVQSKPSLRKHHNLFDFSKVKNQKWIKKQIKEKMFLLFAVMDAGFIRAILLKAYVRFVTRKKRSLKKTKLLQI